MAITVIIYFISPQNIPLSILTNWLYNISSRDINNPQISQEVPQIL
jgi:hypothetical protein